MVKRSHFDELEVPDSADEFISGAKHKSAGKSAGKSGKSGKSTDKITTSIKMDRDLHRRFKLAALEDGRQMGEIMSELVERWLESGDHQDDPADGI